MEPEEIIDKITLDSYYLTDEDLERIDKFIEREVERILNILNEEDIF